jgi:NAD(P)-dependent dehydrogenase (short-subunit alcohol dehydrogenase family)
MDWKNPKEPAMTDQTNKPQISLAHTHAWVTGAQQGIGLAIAVALAQAGAHIVANYLDEGAAASGMQTLSDMGAQVTWVQADLSQTAQIAHLFAQADALGGIDILVNNAGVSMVGPHIKDLTDEVWDTNAVDGIIQARLS